MIESKSNIFFWQRMFFSVFVRAVFFFFFALPVAVFLFLLLVDDLFEVLVGDLRLQVLLAHVHLFGLLLLLVLFFDQTDVVVVVVVIFVLDVDVGRRLRRFSNNPEIRWLLFNGPFHPNLGWLIKSETMLLQTHSKGSG